MEYVLFFHVLAAFMLLGTVEGFLGEGEHVTDYLDSLKTDYDIVLMGRRTYEFGFQFGVTNPYPWLRQYVISRSMAESPDANVKLVSENSRKNIIRQRSGMTVWLKRTVNDVGSHYSIHIT